MSVVPKIYISEEAYLLEERKALEKSEYYKGEVFAMSGASKEHNKIVASLIVAIGEHLKKKDCSFFPSDLRVYNSENTLYTNPDVIVVGGEEKYLDEHMDTLLNPTVIFEVLSPSTENYDRGTKFKLYRSIPSLENYVLISSTEYAAEVFTRSANEQWTLTTTKEKNGHLPISAINFNLPLLEVYAQVPEMIPEG